ncbi:MAG: MBL fold metallo-hydrolase [Chitinophagales bacterium]|nr:MBL fold metallo-hydrolase [Bacteroidota bacterium]MCB9043409.1 MBL fold metallo-hydrolase [Chitinophagales bacterium]
MNRKQFGGKITAYWKEQYQKSPNWHEGVFKNLEATQVGVDWRKMPGILCRQLKGHKQGTPSQALPVLPFDGEKFLDANASPKFIWYGHSVLLMRLHHQNILIDPMFGDDASPIAPKKTKRFSNNTLQIIETLPEIDLVLISHDHYDHLDYESMLQLKQKVKHFFVAMGVKRHLISWGIAAEKISEFDWWDTRDFQQIQITFTPTRHFSGRGISSMAKCLWGGWAFKTPTENIWFSGDGGYGAHFAEIGKKLGPFDLAFMECGQYNQNWTQMHMFPHESVQAAINVKAKIAVPVHWAGFNLSYEHAWYEPAEHFVQSTQELPLKTLTPSLGEIFYLQEVPVSFWWEKFK